jgi:hypothetical protein
MLAGGMALVIPTVVVTLNATAYKPPETDTEEPVQPAVEPPQPNATFKITSDARPAPAKRRSPAARPPALRPAIGLVDIDPERIALGVPALELRPLYSRDELFKFGLTQGQEVRFPVVRAAF